MKATETKNITTKKGRKITLQLDFTAINECGNKNSFFFIRAYYRGKEIASAMFETSNETIYSGNDIETLKYYRRDGIMSEIYKFAEQFVTLTPTNSRTQDGIKFWANRKKI